MKKIYKKVLSFTALLIFTVSSMVVPSFANTPNELSETDIENAIDMFATDATKHFLQNADMYDVKDDLQNLHFEAPFYGYQIEDDKDVIEVNKSIVYYPMVANNKVVSILTLGKTEDGSLFCTLGKDFSDELNNNTGDAIICIGDGEITKIFNESSIPKNYSTDLKEVKNDDFLLPEINISGMDLTSAAENDLRIGANGGTLSNFPKVKQTTGNTCGSACLLAVARYIDPSTFRSWTDTEIHKLVQSNVNYGISEKDLLYLTEYILNDVGDNRYDIYASGRLTTSGIQKTLYNNELPAIAGYGTSSAVDGHYVVLCGFSKSGSNNFSAEFMDPATGSFKYSTAADNSFAIVWGNKTYTWKRTVNIE